MSQRLRAELASLLKHAADQRKRLRELHDSLERLYTRIGRVRAQTEATADPKSGPSAQKASRKK